MSRVVDKTITSTTTSISTGELDDDSSVISTSTEQGGVQGGGAAQEGLLARLSSYTVVNRVYDGYNMIKETNTYLKAGLETAESYTQPVLQKLDDKLHLDAKGGVILDKLETTATKVAETATGLSSKVSETVSGYIHNSADYYAQHRENAIETGKHLVANANRPVNQILDITEGLVDKILPPETSILKTFPSIEEEDYEEETVLDPPPTVDTNTGSTESERLNANPLPRIKQMGTGVTTRLRTVARQRLGQTDMITYVVDLIQYVATLDFGQNKIRDNAGSVHNFLGEKSEEVNIKVVIPAKKIIEQQTAGIKEQSVQTVVRVVAILAHVQEVLRSQFTDKVPSVENLQIHLQEVTNRTRDAILNLKGSELAIYVDRVQKTYKIVLQNIIDLTTMYGPTKIIQTMPLFTQLTSGLNNWRLSLTARLALEELQQQQEEEEKKKGTSVDSEKNKN